jgi:hypothetical protein
MVVTAVVTAAGTDCDATCDTDAFDATGAVSTGEDARSVDVETIEFCLLSTESDFTV